MQINDTILIPLFPNLLSIHNYFDQQPGGSEELFLGVLMHFTQFLPAVNPDAVIWN